MGVIATLLPSATHLRRLRTAIRDRHELIVCEDWVALQRECTRQPVRVAIVDIFSGPGATPERVRQLKLRLPRLTLLAYVAFTPERARDLFEAGRGGVDGLILADRDDAPRPMLAAVEAAASRSLGAAMRRSLDGMEPTAREALLLAITRAHERLSPEGLARLLALPRRTVSQHLSTAGFPPPQRVLTWGRLIVAAHLLEEEHRSADRVASSLGFPSGSAFRNTCQRYVHATPREIRARGGSAYIVRTLLRQIGTAPGGARRSQAAGRSSTRRLALAV